MDAFRRSMCLAFTVVAVALCATSAQAQPYPSKPIVIVVPFPPGGPNDILARAIADRMAPSLKQSVIVDNKAGATGNIGAHAVARSTPDGHTLLLALDTGLTANPVIYGTSMGFDVEDLRPISILGRSSQMLVVHPTTKITNLKQFAEVAHKGLNYASAGHASPGHLTMEALQSLIGGNLNHIPYRGNAPALVDLLGGQVDAGFLAVPTIAQHVTAGKLTALAVSGSKRSSLAPNVPTIAELGYPAGTTEFGFVLMTPAATPEPVVQQLNAEVRKALASEALVDKLRSMDVEPVGSTPQQAAADLKAGRERWTRIIKERGIQPE